MFELVQQLCLPGNPPRPNEDIVGFGSSYCFAMDGASCLSGVHVMKQGSDAAWMVQRVKEGLCALLDAGDSRPTADLLAEVLAPLRKEYLTACRENGLHQPEDAPSAGLALFRVRSGMLEFFGLGDCVGVAALPDGSVFSSTDTELPALDAGVIREMARLHTEEGISMQEARQRCNPLLLENRNRRNRPGGYWILDLLSDDGLAHARQYSWPLTAPVTAAAFSDGFAELSDTFGLYPDYGSLLSAMDSEGLDRLCATLFAAQDADEDCTAHPRFKKRDDTCALWGTFR